MPLPSTTGSSPPPSSSSTVNAMPSRHNHHRSGGNRSRDRDPMPSSFSLDDKDDDQTSASSDDFAPVPEPLGSPPPNSDTSSPTRHTNNSNSKWWWRKRRLLQGSIDRSPPRHHQGMGEKRVVPATTAAAAASNSTTLTTTHAIFLCSLLLSVSFWYFGTTQDILMLILIITCCMLMAFMLQKSAILSNVAPASSPPSPTHTPVTASNTVPDNATVMTAAATTSSHIHHHRHFSLPSFLVSFGGLKSPSPAPSSSSSSDAFESHALLPTSELLSNSITVRTIIQVAMGTLPSSHAVKAITDVTGTDLFILRDECDAILRRDPHHTSFYDLIFSSSSMSQPERDEILAHFKAQVVVDDVETGQQRTLMVISDIDDTLFPTFKDRRGYSWGATYPGVKCLYKELFMSRQPSVSSDNTTWCTHVVFVTARPAFLSSWTLRELRGAGFTTPLVLMGTATSTVTPKSMLNRKLQGCRNLHALYPDREFILVGDNGQKDIDLGVLLLSERLVTHVAVHDIFEAQASGAPVLRAITTEDTLNEPMTRQLSDPLPTPQRGSSSSSLLMMTSTSHDAPQHQHQQWFVEQHSTPIGFRHEECRRFGISLFQTYVGAALAFYHKGVINRDALERVVLACAEEMNKNGGHTRLREAFLRDTARVATIMLNESEKISLWKRVHVYV